jgi:hypothetical protein
MTRKMVMNRIIPAQNFFPLEDDQSYHVFGTVFSPPASSYDLLKGTRNVTELSTALGTISLRSEFEENLANAVYKWWTWTRQHRNYPRTRTDEPPEIIRLPMAVRMRLQRMVDQEKYLGR